ncbi:MAG: DUF2127 domain-containing protein [Acidimicrobiales bacterium]
MFRRNKQGRQYELFTCWWRGHVLVGTDVAHVGEEDSAIVREFDGLRWYRCLRCDSWIAMLPPAEPTRERMPPREEIEVPLRGPFLRDRYVLRLIAVDRAIHVVVLITLAVALFTFARHDASLRKFYTNIMNDLSGGEPGVTQVRGVIGYFRNVVHYSTAHLVALGLAATAYALLEATEGVGLWFGKRWAEYLTLVATSVLLPFEIWELSISVTTLKLIAFIINIAVVIYLLVAKRLFGLRGGHRVQEERHRELGGWPAIDRATPRPNDGEASPESVRGTSETAGTTKDEGGSAEPIPSVDLGTR